MKDKTFARWIFFVLTLLGAIGLIVASIVLFAVPHAMGIIPLSIAAVLIFFLYRDVKTLFFSG